MKMLTKAIERQFTKHPFGSQDGMGANAVVLLKVFNPYGLGTWLVTEAEKRPDGDWELYGLVELGWGWEYGYFLLSELKETKVDVCGLKLNLEREIYSSGKTVGELKKETRYAIPGADD